MLDPCGHLVCTTCWDATDYSACPICHRRIDLDSPFAQPAPAREPLWDPRPLTLLDVGRDLDATATARLHGPAGPHDAARAAGPRGPRRARPPLRRRAGPGPHPGARDDGADLRHLARVRPRPPAPEDRDRRAARAVRRARRRGRPGQAAEAAAEHPAADPAVRAADARRPSAGPARRGRAPPRAALEADRREAAPVRVPGPLPEHGAGVRRDPPHPRGRRLHRRRRRDGHARARAPEHVRHPARGGARGPGRRARAGAGAAPPRGARPPPRPPAAPRRARRRPRSNTPRPHVATPVLLTAMASIRARTRPLPEARLLPARGGDERVRHRRHAPAAPAADIDAVVDSHPGRADRPRRPRGAARHGRARRAPART